MSGPTTGDEVGMDKFKKLLSMVVSAALAVAAIGHFLQGDATVASQLLAGAFGTASLPNLVGK